MSNEAIKSHGTVKTLAAHVNLNVLYYFLISRVHKCIQISSILGSYKQLTDLISMKVVEWDDRLKKLEEK